MKDFRLFLAAMVAVIFFCISARAEETVNFTQSTINGTTASGYVDTYVEWSLDLPPDTLDANKIDLPPAEFAGGDVHKSVVPEPSPLALIAISGALLVLVVAWRSKSA